VVSWGEEDTGMQPFDFSETQKEFMANVLQQNLSCPLINWKIDHFRNRSGMLSFQLKIYFLKLCTINKCPFNHDEKFILINDSISSIPIVC
jgi:hypothetical protein